MKLDLILPGFVCVEGFCLSVLQVSNVCTSYSGLRAREPEYDDRGLFRR